MRTTALCTAGLLLFAGRAAMATDLLEAWRSAQSNGLEILAARQAKQAGDARRLQASALWRPSLQFRGTAGVGNNNTSTRGAQFSAPAFGTSNDVSFDTSVNSGASHRWALEARKPLISGERETQQRSLELSSDAADLEWQAARQELMLRTAERYFDVVQAEVALKVLRRQQAAVERALTEVRDRFTLGAIPITDTHEAAARAEAITAQVLAAQTQLDLARAALSDATGIPATTIAVRQPERVIPPASGESLAQWLADARAGNPRLGAQAAGARIAGEEAARHSLKAATAVDLVAQYSQDYLNGHGDFGSASARNHGGVIGVQVSVPLYTGGYRSAKQEEAVSLAARANTDYEYAKQNLAQQTRATWLALTAGLGRLAALQQGLTANVSRLDATRLAQQVGDRTTLDLLNAENDAAAAELAVLQSRIALLLDRMRLAALAGKLDEQLLESVNATLERP